MRRQKKAATRDERILTGLQLFCVHPVMARLRIPCVGGTLPDPNPAALQPKSIVLMVLTPKA
jgi:hypothetical protein